MKATDYIRELLPDVIAAKLAYHGLRPAPRPITLTFSVTNRCQSRCRTCQIWRLYRAPEELAAPSACSSGVSRVDSRAALTSRPQTASDELTLDEIARIFASLGHVYYFNVSGGEPFLRDGLDEIFALAMKHLTPRVLHTPTNALLPERIEQVTARVLQKMQDTGYDAPLEVKASLDGVGAKHDQIRGVPGNFEHVLETVARLKRLGERFPSLHVEIGTVISRANMQDVAEIGEFVQTLGVESYRNEVAEQRAEFFNWGDPITPSAEEYAALMTDFTRRIRENLKHKRELARLTESLRLVYYDYAAATLREKRQVLPCYGGITNAHINPYGQLWPCCVLGYDQPLGELRAADYDFWRVWRSEQAAKVRAFIKGGGCACPLANQMYSNILCDPRATWQVARNWQRYREG
jgi:MoaA/NifB/PqqE/SkfB family radical SAM enzyme